MRIRRVILGAIAFGILGILAYISILPLHRYLADKRGYYTSDAIAELNLQKLADSAQIKTFELSGVIEGASECSSGLRQRHDGNAVVVAIKVGYVCVRRNGTFNYKFAVPSGTHAIYYEGSQTPLWVTR
jgi:hypothetical protein